MKDSSNCLVSSQYLADLVAPSPAILKPYTQSRRQSRRTKVGRIQSDKYSSLGKFVSKNPEVAQQSLQDYSHVSDLAKDLGSKVVVACYCLCSLLSPAASHAVDLPEQLKDIRDQLQDVGDVILDNVPSVPLDKIPPLPFVSDVKSDVNPLQKVFRPNDPEVKADKQRVQKQKEKKELEKEDKERREKIQREEERIKRERERLFKQQAILGGSALGIGALFIGKWQAVAAGAALLFRTVGGPTILSTVLRSPGFLFGRSVRVVEWDVARSPHIPNGRVVSFTLRALTPVGLRQAIVKNCELQNGIEVKQICHWIQIGPNFFEPLTTVPAFRMLPDPSWIVWSRRARRGADAIPYRLDENRLAVQEQNPFGALLPSQELNLILKTLNAASALSRKEDRYNTLQRYFGVQSNGRTSQGSADYSAEVGKDGSNGGQHNNGKKARFQGAADSSERSIVEEFEEDERKRAEAQNQQNLGIVTSSLQNAPIGTSSKHKEATAMAKDRKQSFVGHVGNVYRGIQEAAADPLNATRDALGLPTPDCKESMADTPALLPQASHAGQSADSHSTELPSIYQGAAKIIAGNLTGVDVHKHVAEISLEEEGEMIGTTLSVKADGIRKLFQVYAHEDILAFITFARAYTKLYRKPRVSGSRPSDD